VPRSAPRSRFLEPSTLAAIKDLRLVARTIVDGFLAGEHLDRRPGAGVEFSQYRSYQPGDDLRRVDWRVYARSDRFFVRESEVERDITVRLVLDATASMAHRDGVLSKLEYARFLMAALAYLADLQGDRVSFHAVMDGTSIDLPAHRGRRSLRRVLHRLEEVEASGAWPDWDELGHRIAGAREREVVVVASDLYDERGQMRRALATLEALGHEVLVLHLMARNELDFDYRGDLAFEDLETGATVGGDAEAMRVGYLDRLRRGLESWRVELLEMGVTYELLAIDRPVDRALRSFLLRRGRLP
jgi:uncharacterized protein (DUF58 family)